MSERESYGVTAGDRVRLVHTDDPWTRLKPGDEGVIVGVHRADGSVSVSWNGGSSLRMMPEFGDVIEVTV